MASPGNPNLAGPVEMNKFFKPAPNSPNLASSPFSPPAASYPLPSLYSYPQTTPSFHYQPHHLPPNPDLPNLPQPQRSLSYPTPPLQPPNHGARLMALLNTPPPTSLDFPQETSLPASIHMVPPIPNSAVLQPPPVRTASSKIPRGRQLSGDRVEYDIDVRLQGEVQPQLEVTPITKYASDPQLVVGRQIAVNRTYICYGLKLGAIRILNINTATRSLLRNHTQRVTDMALFAEDVHLLASASVDGRVCVCKITEGPDENDKQKISGTVTFAIQIVGDEEALHPRLCWHSHKQEVLVIGFGKRILRIDTTKAGKGETFSADEPLKCPVDKLGDGVTLVGKHEGEVTELSTCQWMVTRLVSASMDGSIKIWEDRKSLPIAVLKPHDGLPVYSAAFLTAPHRPDHILMITGGPLNRELKLWASAGEEGWLLPSESEAWNCIQTLELKSSAVTRCDEAFFNQVVGLPQAGLILLANAKKNAIYALHIDYSPHPSATRIDYISEFTVTMPILSFTGTSDPSFHGEHIIQIYCVQTQAIQQYALDISRCVPSLSEPHGIEKSEDATLGRKTSIASEIVKSPLISTDPEIGCVDSQPSQPSQPSEPPLSPNLSGKSSMFRSPATSFDQEQPEEQSIIDYPTGDDSKKDETKDDASRMFKHPTHLITPSEILMTVTSSESIRNVVEVEREREADVLDGTANGELEVKIVGETALTWSNEGPSRDDDVKDAPEESTKGIIGKVTDFQGQKQKLKGSSSFTDEPPVPRHDTLTELLTIQKETQNQMAGLVTAPVNKEGRRLEAALGRNIEKSIKANSDALWARFQEELMKHEKLLRERTQQITNSIANFVNKDFPAMLEKGIKKEIAAIGPSVSKTVTTNLEKTVSSVITETLQKAVGEKVLNQVEKSVNTKLEATIARQIQTQFQTSGKQALHDAMKAGFEGTVIPAFELSCKAMFDQVDLAFQKGMAEHTSAAQHNIESAHAPLALALRDAISSASSMTQTLTTELADGQRKLLALAAAGASSQTVNPMATQLSNGSLTGLHEKHLEASIDPTAELSRMLHERKYEEAFTTALQRSDVSIVSWLCYQVDLPCILSMIPVPLSQGVLLSLLQQLACDITNDTERKVGWMTDVVVAINPADRTIAMHVRPIFDQVLQILNHYASLPTTTRTEVVRSIRIVMKVINSVLISSK